MINAPVRPRGEAFRQKAVSVAYTEKVKWFGLTERDAAARDYLKRYWTEGIGFSNAKALGAIQNQTYWSAAFISWVMYRSGAGRNFKYSAAHSVYCAAAKQNRLKNSPNPFWLFRPSEYAPRVGDLICNARDGSGLTYENVDDGSVRAAHSNLVVQVGVHSLLAVGGNLDNSVRQVSVPFDSEGKVSSQDYFGVLRTAL